MQPTRIDIGMELYGDDGGFSPQARWSYNKWIANNMTRYYQTRYGDRVTINAPVRAGWGVNEAPPQSSTGGNWYADCC